jgi:hypothetical protein
MPTYEDLCRAYNAQMMLLEEDEALLEAEQAWTMYFNSEKQLRDSRIAKPNWRKAVCRRENLRKEKENRKVRCA